MASEWQETTLGLVTDFLSGGTPSKDDPRYWNGSVPWVSAKDMKRFRIGDTEDHVTEQGVANGTKLVPAGTVLVLTRGMTLLNDIPICVADRAVTFNQDVKAIRPKSGIRSDFLPYLFLGNKSRLLGLVDLAGHGTGRLNSNELKSLDIRVPPKSEQRAIAHILGTLDNKIELNRKMNETLEAMARALFKSWFVNFDPVRAKSEGRGSELPGTIAAIFSDSLKDSHLGEIPNGWQARSLSEILIEVTERVGNSDLPEYSSTNSGLQLRSERFKKNLSASPAKNKLVRHGSLVFGLSRRVLNFGLMRDKAGSVSSAYKVFEVDDRAIAPDLLETLMRHQSNYYYNAISASSREGQAVTSEAVGALYFLQPPKKVQQKFYELFGPFDSKRDVLKEESRTLAELRDALLPKLISGKIRVKDAEKIVGAAA